MSQIPTPLRAALGLVANAIDGARTLPDKAVELPVMAVSTALQFSLRAQQRYAELTLRGDELLSRLHGLPEEPPDWATFDDEQAGTHGDDPGTAPAAQAAASPAPATASQPMTSAAKQPRVRKSAPAKKSAAKTAVAGKAKSAKRASAAGAKTVRAKRSAKPSAFDAVGDAGTPPDVATPGTSEG
jgi:hypothetical protein